MVRQIFLQESERCEMFSILSFKLLSLTGIHLDLILHENRLSVLTQSLITFQVRGSDKGR